ncbi:MAG: hypothetical protein K5672_04135 [Bacteroidaceae bacterium]|nr:hypothetical protein [Bacteroidaceae bacterium]
MGRKLLHLCLMTIMMVLSTVAYALDKTDGVYQIGTAEDFNEFAALVNDGNVTANAALTADIDLGMTFTMVGVNDGNGAYHGTFDGKGHTIKFNMFSKENYAAVFRYVGWRAVIQNLKVEGTIDTNSKFAAGLAGRNRGTIRNCWTDITINSTVAGDATHGGLAGTATNGAIIENCLVKVAILGNATQNCGGVVGWADSKVNIVNCLLLNDESSFDISNGNSRNLSRNDGNVLGVVNLAAYKADSYTTRPTPFCYNNYVTTNWDLNNKNSKGFTLVPYADLADGKICYQLNNDQSRIAWVQRIGTDPFPVPAPFGSGQVYASGPTDCKGTSDATLTYSNTASNAVATTHQFDKYGICTECGLYNFHIFDLDDATKCDKDTRTVFLGSKDDFVAAEGLNRVVNGFKLHMKMTADVEYICEPGRTIFNNNDWIEGNFDGDGHALTIEMTDMGDEAALFPVRHYGSVENLIMHGKIETSGMHWGSISNDSYESAVRNVYSDINITSSHEGDNTGGGLFGMIRTGKNIDNCIYAGTITLPGEGSPCACVGGLAGWTHAMTSITNCAILGHIYGAGDQCAQSKTENSSNVARNWGNIECKNVYVANPIQGKDIKDQDKYIHYENTDGIANGELAFLLNGKQQGLERFWQRIGTDAMPLPIPKEGGLIYSAASRYTCDGTPVGAIYQNTPAGEPNLDPHEFDKLGLCTKCGAIQEDFMTPVDGWYEIGTPEQFLWWSNYASKHLDASAKLVADIDLDDYNETIERDGNVYTVTPKFAQVGSEYAPFYGNFDGQSHTISNLNIYLLGKRGCGLISVMNSQPDDKLSERGLTADQARAEEGVYVKDVILDETCSITGGGYTGIVGMGAPWAGHVTITGCMNLGDVYVVDGTNGAGIYGCSMGSACRVTINACGMIGDIHVTDNNNSSGKPRTENGSFSGWLGSYAEVTNCFALGEVELIDPNRGFARHSAGAYNSGAVIVKNCYALDGIGIKQVDNDDKKEDVSFVSMDDLETGSITWKANGSQFRNPVWYQTLEKDQYPYPVPTHGVVIYATGKYFSMLTKEDITDVATAIQADEDATLGEDPIATQAVIDKLTATIDALSDVNTIDGLADALDSLSVAKKAFTENAAVYKAYMDKCKEIKDYLDEKKDFSGELRDELEYYLAETDDPSETNPLGTYQYIIEEHTATVEEIKAETERVAKWLQEAIESGYIPGTDISGLIPNSDFSKERNNWTNGWCNGYGQCKDTAEKTYYGVEAWNATGDMHQSVEGMKPGYYLVGINGAFRPSNNRYSTNYAAGIYANGIFNYFPAVNEDIVLVNDTVDQGNCNLHGAGALDLAIYDDGYSTDDSNGAELLGYAVHGETGMAIAAMANRYQAYTIANVGEDGKLTIGIKNPGTKYGNDWTGWGALKVVYCGDDETVCNEALDKVIENMKERALTILAYKPDQDAEDPAAGPNFPAALKEDLEALVAQADGAEDVAAKAELAAKFSDIFQQIYEGKQAYLQLAKTAKILEYIDRGNLNIVQKNPETGEWQETENLLYSMDESDALYAAAQNLLIAYADGSYSIEEALNPSVLKDPIIASIIPALAEDGYYMISTPKHFASYRTIASEVDATAKAKLVNDVDMTGIAMQPIGHNRSGEGGIHIYRGTLDGQGHALTNVYISEDYMVDGEPATLFYELKGSTVKNFKLTGEYYNTQNNKFMGGLTRWTSENSTIDNCEIEVVMHSFIEGDGTHGGVVGVSAAGTVIKNCLVNVTMIGEGKEPTYNCGGVVGWANSTPTISNTLILSQYQNITKGDNSNTIGRNGYTANNVYYIERSMIGNTDGGTKATDEALASGEICWALNGNSAENPYWFQRLGTDAMPHLFGGGIVWKVDDEYQNTRPNPQLNAFASNLSTATNASQVAVAYTLNAQAKSAAINFYVGDELRYSHVLKDGELMAGGHEVVVDNSLLGVAAGTKMTYELDVTSVGVKTPTKVGESYKVWGPYGMAINNNPASKGFGQILLAESYPEEIDNIYISHNKPGALYAFDANFQPINAADGTPGFYGGLSIKGETPLAIVGNYKFDLKDLRFTEDGRLFVARASGTNSSSVYEINPENLDEPWKPVFKGGTLDEATGITYVGEQEQNRMALSLAFEGKGENLKMYVLGAQRSDGEHNATDYNCSVYNLGTATEWTGAPSASFDPLNGKYTYSSYSVGIHEDGLGGLWFVQNQHSEEYPALKHFNAAEGKEDYSDITTSTNGGRIAVTTDGKYLAIPMGSGKIVLYESTYEPNAIGEITIKPFKIINVSESSIASLAFDYANNLYVASGGTETFSRYAIPSWNDNKAVTPCAEGFTVGTDSGDPDAIKSLTPALSEGEGAIYNMAGLRVSKAQKGIYIQDGRKVANK